MLQISGMRIDPEVNVSVMPGSLVATMRLPGETPRRHCSLPRNNLARKPCERANCFYTSVFA